MKPQSAVLMIAGNSSLADNILSKRFKEIAPIFGTKIEGPEKFKSTIDGLFSVSALINATQSHDFHLPFFMLQEPCSMLSSLQNYCKMLRTNWTHFAHDVAGALMTLLTLHHSVCWHW